MKKAAVITFLHNDNYGSTLQAWALQRVLTEQGWDAVHLDYAPDSKEKLLNLLMSGNSPKLVLEGMRKRSVKAEQTGAKEKSAAFLKFYHEEMKLTSPCRNSDDLKQAASGMDVLVAGSDQIWSPVWLNPAYFLNWAKGVRKAAYAPSLGVDRIDDSRKAKRMAAWIRDFDAVSVREAEGAAALSSMLGAELPIMPDPALLIEKEDWQSLAVPYAADKPYLACYFIGDRPDYWEKARSIAKAQGLEIVVIPVTAQAYAAGLPLAEGLGPKEWLGCLNGAELVLTDSFHGAAFSCLLGRRLNILRRYAEDDPESKNSRIDQLARALQIENGCVDDPEALAPSIAALREKGREWLRSAMEECGE